MTILSLGHGRCTCVASAGHGCEASLLKLTPHAHQPQPKPMLACLMCTLGTDWTLSVMIEGAQVTLLPQHQPLNKSANLGPGTQVQTTGADCFPPNALLTLFSKSFSSFPQGTCLLLVSCCQYLALGGIYHPQILLRAAFPNNPTLGPVQLCCAIKTPVPNQWMGLSPSLAPFSKGLLPNASASAMPDHKTTIWCTPYAHPDLELGLFQLCLPLLRESLLVSFPLFNNMLKFSG